MVMVAGLSVSLAEFLGPNRGARIASPGDCLTGSADALALAFADVELRSRVRITQAPFRLLIVRGSLTEQPS